MRLGTCPCPWTYSVISVEHCIWLVVPSCSFITAVVLSFWFYLSLLSYHISVPVAYPTDWLIYLFFLNKESRLIVLWPFPVLCLDISKAQATLSLLAQWSAPDWKFASYTLNSSDLETTGTPAEHLAFPHPFVPCLLAHQGRSWCTQPSNMCRLDELIWKKPKWGWEGI